MSLLTDLDALIRDREARFCGEVIAKSAFTNSLAEIKASGNAVPILKRRVS